MSNKPGLGEYKIFLLQSSHGMVFSKLWHILNSLGTCLDVLVLGHALALPVKGSLLESVMQIGIAQQCEDENEGEQL